MRRVLMIGLAAGVLAYALAAALSGRAVSPLSADAVLFVVIVALAATMTRLWS